MPDCNSPSIIVEAPKAEVKKAAPTTPVKTETKTAVKEAEKAPVAKAEVKAPVKAEVKKPAAKKETAKKETAKKAPAKKPAAKKAELKSEISVQFGGKSSGKSKSMDPRFCLFFRSLSASSAICRNIGSSSLYWE